MPGSDITVGGVHYIGLVCMGGWWIAFQADDPARVLKFVFADPQ